MNTIRIALRALGKNKSRAGLTVLGVVIGIAAVTMMVSIGQSASGVVQREFQSVGTNVLVVMPGSESREGVQRTSAQSLTAADANAIPGECSAVLATSPLVGASGQIIYGNNNWSPKEVFGVGPDYLTVRNWPLRNGGFFTQQDVTSAAKVCVIGQTLVANLFQTMSPVGKTVRIKNIPLEIIGILEPKGANFVGEDQDNIIMIPYTTVQKRIQGSNFDSVHAIIVSARSTARMVEAQIQIEQLLYERHRIPPREQPDFQIHNMIEIANMLGMITSTMTAMLSAIAAISLVVGGVGIMNVMLVSVTERTREIGIRMAVGARGRDILRQFLVEAIILSSIGGIIGLGLGIGASAGVTMLINSFTSGTKWPIAISVPAALIAMLFAAAVGVFFGFYPALRASKLDPIDALRYD